MPKSAGIAPNPTKSGLLRGLAEGTAKGVAMRRNRRGGGVSRPALHAGGRRFDPCTAHSVKALLVLASFRARGFLCRGTDVSAVSRSAISPFVPIRAQSCQLRLRFFRHGPAPTEGDVAALAHGDELVGRNDLPAAGVQFVEVVNLQPDSGRAAALAAPSCSIENSGAKPLPRPASLPRVRGAEGATRPRRAWATRRLRRRPSANHTASMTGGDTPGARGRNGASLAAKKTGRGIGDAGVRFEANGAPPHFFLHRLSIKLTDHEYEELEARAAAEGTTKAAIVRAAIASARARGAELI